MSHLNGSPRKMVLEHQGGGALLEVLVTMLILAFGLLGYVGLQARTTLSQIEAYQRTQALVLVNDMAHRLRLNLPNASAYVANDIGTQAQGDCGLLTSLAARDVCEWSLMIQGAAELDATNKKLGAITNARACITSPSANVYIITLVWQGVQPSGAPSTVCGKDVFASEDTRRAVNTVVQVAMLGAGVTP